LSLCLDGGRGLPLLDELHGVANVLGAVARAFDRVGELGRTAGSGDEVVVNGGGLLEHGNGVRRLSLGLVFLRQDRLVVEGLGTVGRNLLALVELGLRLVDALVEVRVVDLTADGKGETEVAVVVVRANLGES
jgi:hypothetical protein